jgi:FG-GAP repeat/Bacterial TSP3 repeat
MMFAALRRMTLWTGVGHASFRSLHRALGAGYPATRLLAPALALLAICSSSFGQGSRTEDQRLLPPNPQDSGGIGFSVSVSGDLAAVSAMFANVTDSTGTVHPQAGAVHVYRLIDGVWEFEAEIVPESPDLVDWAWFGFDVSVSPSPHGDMLVVGHVWWGDSFNGAVYVFRKTALGWRQEARLTETPPEDIGLFGFSVAAGPDVLVATTPQHDSARGAFYVFRFDGTNWTQEAGPVTPARAEPNTQVGEEVAMFASGSTELILVSAARFPATDHTGTAYVYRRTPGEWVLDTPAEGLGFGLSQPYDAFGLGVSIHGDVAAVAAPARTVGGFERAGAVSLFHYDGTSWQWEQTLPNPNPGLNHLFGRELIVSGNQVVIGVPNADDTSGCAYAFTRDGSAWGDPLKLGASDADPGDQFGAIAFGDGWAIVGAAYNDLGAADTGSAYAFHLGTAPVDTDGDGLLDTEETGTYHTHPLNPDTDADGLNDGAEVARTTNPLDADSDDDGLLDGDEVQRAAFGDCPSPLVADSDMDGMTDGIEVAFGLDPCDSDFDDDGLADGLESSWGTNPAIADSDADGLLDGTEVDMAQGGGCPNATDADSDGDTLLDGIEVLAGTNPCNPDSDGDGVPDNLDPWPTVPGVPGGFLEAIVRDLQTVVIPVLPLPLVVAPNANARAGRINALANKAGAAANAIAIEDYALAIVELQGLLEKIDGLTPPPDWMVDSPEKSMLADEVRLYIALLELM